MTRTAATGRTTTPLIMGVSAVDYRMSVVLLLHESNRGFSNEAASRREEPGKHWAKQVDGETESRFGPASP